MTDAARFSEPSYTDFNEHRLGGLFEGAGAERFVEIVNDIQAARLPDHRWPRSSRSSQGSAPG